MTYPLRTTAELLLDMRTSAFPDRRQLAADYDALAARLAEEESAHRVTAGIFASTLVRADAAEARLAEAERKIAGALRTAGGRWCEWGSRAESVRDILQGTTDSASGVQK